MAVLRLPLTIGCAFFDYEVMVASLGALAIVTRTMLPCNEPKRHLNASTVETGW